MVTEVYADLYVLVNAGMDLLCLMITAALLRRRIHRLRLLLASLLGGLYALAALLLGLGGLIGFLLDLLAALGMCAVTFCQRGLGWGALLRASVTCGLTSALLGGVMTALFTWLNRLDLPLELLQGDGLSVWMLAILAAVAGLLTVKGGRLFARAKSVEAVTVEAELLGKRIALRAMVDSGNLLRDPISGKGVIVVERARLVGFFPRSLLEGDGWDEDAELACRVRLIPTATATGQGLLVAIRPDRVYITDRDGRSEGDYLLAAAELGSRANGFDALIGRD